MKLNKPVLPARPASALLLVVTLAALTFLSLRTDNASYAQTQPPAALDAPVLTAVAGDNSIELSWAAVTGAARYELWAWTSADAWQRLDDGALTATTFSHTGLITGTTYFYWVRAENDDGEASEWSERQDATYVSTTPTATPPSTVAMLAIPVLTAAAGQSAVELTWAEVTGADRYELWTWTSAGGWQQLDDGALTGTTFSHTDVAVGTTYHYAIRALNAAGRSSEWSEFVSLTWTPAAPRRQPQLLPRLH